MFFSAFSELQKKTTTKNCSIKEEVLAVPECQTVINKLVTVNKLIQHGC